MPVLGWGTVTLSPLRRPPTEARLQPPHLDGHEPPEEAEAEIEAGRHLHHVAYPSSVCGEPDVSRFATLIYRRHCFTDVTV
jgi:hypothetical protein